MGITMPRTPLSQIPTLSNDQGINDKILTEICQSKGTLKKLHLGCGETLFPDYINIDFPPSQHNVMTVVPDAYADLKNTSLLPNSIDEIRSHHLFEHFNRVFALSMLIKWHECLKPGGSLVIETPDIMGCARTLVSNGDLKVQTGIVRHLAGDQAADWAYHLDHWFPDRFNFTLSTLGFSDVSAKTSQWPHEPFLSNVTAQAIKTENLSRNELVARAFEILKYSMVASVETPTWSVWCQQLEDALSEAPTAPIQSTNEVEQFSMRIPVALST